MDPVISGWFWLVGLTPSASAVLPSLGSLSGFSVVDVPSPSGSISDVLAHSVSICVLLLRCFGVWLGVWNSSVVGEEDFLSVYGLFFWCWQYTGRSSSGPVGCILLCCELGCQVDF